MIKSSGRSSCKPGSISEWLSDTVSFLSTRVRRTARCAGKLACSNPETTIADGILSTSELTCDVRRRWVVILPLEPILGTEGSVWRLRRVDIERVSVNGPPSALVAGSSEASCEVC
jgi:hypothetical protein